jgi:hypothetical protein
VINDKGHIAPNLLISSCLEPNSSHGLPYHIMSYLIIDLVIWCWKFFIPAKGVICVHFFMCMTLLVLKMLGDNLVTQHVSNFFARH